MPYLVPDHIDQPLWVIVPQFNPIRFKSRWKWQDRFVPYAKMSGAQVMVVEASFGERAHTQGKHEEPVYNTELTKGDDGAYHLVIHVRTQHELWLKENLIRIGMAHLPETAKYVAWIDGDVAFVRDNWVGETIHLLQHYDFIQMWSHALDLGPIYQPIQHHQGFVYNWANGDEKPGFGYYGKMVKGKPYTFHPGYAWAAKRSALDSVGGLIDWAILGAADNHMANALIGKVEESFHHGVHPAYRDKLLFWQKRAEANIRRNIGFMSGLLVHYWHGKKRDRRYWDRWQILVKHQYNPLMDVEYDTQGLIQLVDHGDLRSIALRDDLRNYFRQRNEDSIDVE